MAGSRSLPKTKASRLGVAPCRWTALPAVYRIHKASFPYPYPFSRFVGYQFLQSGRIFVAGPIHPVGYVIATLSPREFPPRPVGEIISLAVLADHRCHGHGEALLRQAMQWLWTKPIDRILLQVAVDNRGAQKLYQRLGFERTERLPAYYVSGEDAFLMSKARD